MLRSVGRSSLLIVGLVFASASCNGNGSPVGSRTGTTTTTVDFQAAQSNQAPTGPGNNFGGLQATDTTLTAVLEAMNTARSKAGLPPYSRDPVLDSCANQIAVDFSQGGQPTSICGASQISAGSLAGAADMTTAGLSAVQQWLNEGTPPAPQQNDNTNILSPTFATVGIGIVTGAGKTFIIVLFK